MAKYIKKEYSDLLAYIYQSHDLYSTERSDNVTSHGSQSQLSNAQEIKRQV